MIPLLIACAIGLAAGKLCLFIAKKSFEHKYGYALEEIAYSQDDAEWCSYCQPETHNPVVRHRERCPVSIAREALK